MSAPPRERTERADGGGVEAWAALEPLLAAFADVLAEALAPRLAALLGQQATHEGTQPPLRRLVTLDQLVELLPAGRSPATWRRWLYQRTRLQQVPGCHKIGGRLYFDHEQTIPWLSGEPLDLPAEQSLHDSPMQNQSVQASGG